MGIDVCLGVGAGVYEAMGMDEWTGAGTEVGLESNLEASYCGAAMELGLQLVRVGYFCLSPHAPPAKGPLTVDT